MREGRGYDLSIMKFRFAKTFQPSSRPALSFEIEKGKKGRGRKREALIQRGAAKEGVDLGKHTRGHPFRSVNANRYRPCREFLRRPLFQPVVRTGFLFFQSYIAFAYFFPKIVFLFFLAWISSKILRQR